MQNGSEEMHQCVKNFQQGQYTKLIQDVDYASGLRSLEGRKAVSFNYMMKASERVLDERRSGVASGIPDVDDKWNPSVMKHRLKVVVGCLRQDHVVRTLTRPKSMALMILSLMKG